ncbi:MAG: MoaD/ThiS family protein [Actinomycetota bacterium]|nr:MoaD/ThiS family protein [Actinomycetota bacterium]
MATVTLRAPLKDLAGGQDLEIPGGTVGEVIRALEAQHPKLRGWILDEQGHVRQHVNVFVNGERMAEDTDVSATDRLHVLASISGGCAS